MHPFNTIAVRAARAAGNIIMRGLNRLDTLQIETKHDKDFVSEIDRQSEEEIIKIIRRTSLATQPQFEQFDFVCPKICFWH